MTRNLLLLPTAALALSACGPDEERAAPRVDPQLPRAEQQAQSDVGSAYDPNYRDPSIPQNSAHKDPTKKDSSPPAGTGDPAVRQ